VEVEESKKRDLKVEKSFKVKRMPPSESIVLTRIKPNLYRVNPKMIRVIAKK